MKARDLVVAVWFLALVAAGSACASRDTDDGVASAGGGAHPAGTPSAAGDRQRWLRCLEEQGVKMLDGKPDYEQMDKEKTAAAERACAQFDTPDDLARPLTAAEIEAWRKWAQCMRDKGIDMGDPDPAVAGGRPVPRSTRSSLADLQRAEQLCENLAVPTAGLGR